MNTRTLRANGLEFEILEAGAEQPRQLLLVHGFAGSKEDFAHYLPRLAATGWHAVVPDLRGHGDSAKPPDESAYSLAILADDVKALLDALGWEKATMLGHSMGGMVLQLFALAHPGRVTALVLMSTSHAMPEQIPPELIALAQALVREGGTELLIETARLNPEPSPLDTLPYLELIAADPSHKAWSDYKLRNMAASAYAALADDIVGQRDRIDALKSLTMPTLVVVGEYDHVFLDQSIAISQAIPTSALAVIPGGGHSPQFEAPLAWWSAVRRFLEQRSQASAGELGA